MLCTDPRDSAVVWPDALYSAVAVLSAKSGELGAVLERYEYDPYGRATIFGKSTDADAACTAPLAHSAVRLPFFFTGQRLDAETGLCYFKNRHFPATIGRLTTADPAEGSINLFEHVGADPVGATDPEGLEEKWDDSRTGGQTHVTNNSRIRSGRGQGQQPGS